MHAVLYQYLYTTRSIVKYNATECDCKCKTNMSLCSAQRKLDKVT